MDNKSHVWNHQPGYVLILRRMSFTHFTLDQVGLKHGLLRILVLLQVTLRFAEAPNSWYHSPKGKSLNCWVAALLFWDEARFWAFEACFWPYLQHRSTRNGPVQKIAAEFLEGHPFNGAILVDPLPIRGSSKWWRNHRLEKSRKELNSFGVAHTQCRDYHYIVW